MHGLDLESIRKAISGHTNRQIANISFLTPEKRRYSHVLLCDVDFSGESVRYVVKRSDADVVGPHHLQTRAEIYLRDYPGFVKTAPFVLERQRIIISRYLPSRPLSSMFAVKRFSDLFSSADRVRYCVGAVGAWLKQYHTMDWRPNCDETLTPYLDKRPELLRCVPESVARRLVGIASEPISGPSVAIHGDFTAHNILFAGKTFTVIDFDAYDWKRMTPFWDVACMIVSLQRSGLFSPCSPFFWRPNRMELLVTEFLQSYGFQSTNHRELYKCLAVRHLTHYGSDPSGSPSKRQAWHMRKVTEMLARVDASSRI